MRSPEHGRPAPPYAMTHLTILYQRLNLVLLLFVAFATCAVGRPAIAGETDHCSHATSHPITILYLGNSYTASNNLPELVNHLACSLGIKIESDTFTPGSYSFQDHQHNPASLKKIQSNKWDFVVLQNQSQIPSWKPGAVEKHSLPYAQQLAAAIRYNNPNTVIVYFQTWGRRDGDKDNCEYYPLVCTFEGHAQALIQGYDLYKARTGGRTAPVGAAWRSVVNDPGAPFPARALWAADGSHPSLRGSYLAAAVFVRTFFSIPVTGSDFTGGLNEAEARYLQQQTDRAVK